MSYVGYSLLPETRFNWVHSTSHHTCEIVSLFGKWTQYTLFVVQKRLRDGSLNFLFFLQRFIFLPAMATNSDQTGIIGHLYRALLRLRSFFPRVSPSSAFRSYLYDNATVDHCNRSDFQLIIATGNCLRIMKATEKCVRRFEKHSKQWLFEKKTPLDLLVWEQPHQPMEAHPCHTDTHNDFHFDVIASHKK